MTKSIPRTVLQITSLAGLIACILVAVWGWRTGVLTSQDSLRAYMAQVGSLGVVLFVAFQAVQVVIPVLPGGLGCLVGVVLLGPVHGFLCNYIGICVGSMMAFGVAKNCGRPLMEKLFSEKTITKYNHWADEKSPFAKWFAIAIFLPVAPDDFLCYLAGTTKMSWKQFTLIIWLCKPFAIAVYSLGLTMVWNRILALLH